MNRVVITGMGVASPVGHALDRFWSALIEPRSGVRALTIIPTERLNTRIAAQIDDFDPAAHFESKFANQLDRMSQFAVLWRPAPPVRGFRHRDVRTTRASKPRPSSETAPADRTRSTIPITGCTGKARPGFTH